MTRTFNARARSGSEPKHDRSGLKGTHLLTKKGGAGENYTWGKPGDEINAAPVLRGDPNYDSEEEDLSKLKKSPSIKPLIAKSFTNESLFRGHDFSYLNIHGEALTPPSLNLQQFKEEVTKAVNEYLIEGELQEFITRIREFNSEMLHYELVKKLVVSSMGKDDRERELVSVILVELQEESLLPTSQVAKGFERLFESMDDLKLDIPNIDKYLAQFLARCVVDEVLPPAFLNDKYILSLAGRVVDHAKVLLSIKHGLGRLENVWGLNLSASVEDLKSEVKMILMEYLSSSDCTEVATLLRNLHIPFFYHEVIKRGVVLSLEGKEREQAMISVLFKELVQNDVISSEQVILGFQRLYQDITDLELDNPDARAVLNIFAAQAVQDGILREDELSELKVKAKENYELEKKIASEFQN